MTLEEWWKSFRSTYCSEHGWEPDQLNCMRDAFMAGAAAVLTECYEMGRAGQTHERGMLHFMSLEAETELYAQNLTPDRGSK